MKPKLDCGGFGPADTKTCINTPSGVSSLVASIPFAALFSGYLCMVTVLPQMARERASFYRERFSKMYSPEIHGLAYFLSEIPYVILFAFLWYSESLWGSGGRCGLTNASPMHSAPLFHARPSAHGRKVLYFHSHHGPEPRRLDRNRADCSGVLPHRGHCSALPRLPCADVVRSISPPGLPRWSDSGQTTAYRFMFCGVFLQKSLIPEGASSNPLNNHPHIYFQWLYYLDFGASLRVLVESATR